MKKNLLLTTLVLLFINSAFSQINHVDYGDGLIIAQNENYAMDINEDGIVDFYVNKYPDELGFSPIFGIGCFASESAYATNTFNARQLQVFEEGEIIEINGATMYDYIDDDRASIYDTDGVIDEYWTPLEDQIIGIAVFGNSLDGNVLSAWMRVAVDTETNTLIIKEYAYTDWSTFGNGSIVAGERGVTAVNNLDDVLDQIDISPNPVKDQFKLSFNYSGKEELQISILDYTGKIMSSQIANGTINQTYDTSDWAAGMYLVNFKTSEGVSTEKIFVTK